MKFATVPRIQRPKLQTSTSQRHEILAPATRKASFQSLFKSPTPANVFATLTNSCACHSFWNVSKSLRLPREKHFEPQKVARDPGVFTILTSKSLSRAGVVQILRSSTSKSAPNMQRGAFFSRKTRAWCKFCGGNRSRARAWRKFCGAQLPKALRSDGALTILTSKSISRHTVAQIVCGPQLQKALRTHGVVNDFDFQIVLARRRGANFVDVSFQECSEHASF